MKSYKKKIKLAKFWAHRRRMWRYSAHSTCAHPRRGGCAGARCVMHGHPRRARLSARARRCALRCRRYVAVEQPRRGCISCGIAWRWRGVARRCRGGSSRRSGGCNHVAASLDRLAIRRSTGWRYGGRTGGDTLVDPAAICWSISWSIRRRSAGRSERRSPSRAVSNP